MTNAPSHEMRFKGMLARIFSDGVVTSEERRELDAALASGALHPERVQAVMKEFLEKSFAHFMADGQITDSERAKLTLIVRELRLPDACVPEAVKRIVG